MDNNRYLNILFPVYNEKLRLEKGITKTISYMDHLMREDYWITIIDNASSDETPEIAKKLCLEFSQVKYQRIQEKGVGAAFRAGIADNTSPVVGYMDIDLSTDIRHLKKVVRLFQTDADIGMVNGSRWSRRSDTQGRKWYRNLTSHGLTVLLKLCLGMKASDAICGFKFYRKDVARHLVQKAGEEENGWFYIIELLLRAERENVPIYELPVRWRDDYHTKVNVPALIQNYLAQMIKLKRKFRKEKKRYGV